MAHMAQPEEAWLATLPPPLQLPARTLLGQIVVVAETIAGRLESSNPEEVTQGLHSIKATLRQKIREASQHIDVDKPGQVVAEKMMSKYGSEKSLAIIATLTSLLSDAGHDAE